MSSKTDPNHIFVFGSNMAGRHGKGAALTARNLYGAKYGVGFGPMGNCYAIPTKDRDLKTLPLSDIKKNVELFLTYAANSPDSTFKVTAIGTGLAGYSHEEIGPMFAKAPSNCILPSQWEKYRVSE